MGIEGQGPTWLQSVWFVDVDKPEVSFRYALVGDVTDKGAPRSRTANPPIRTITMATVATNHEAA